MQVQGIYKITNTINNKMYIGSSNNILNRWKTHLDNLMYNNHHSYKLQNDFNIYGIDKFTFEILELVNDKNNLLNAEQEWIDEYQSYDDSVGYNILPNTNTKKILKNTASTFNDIDEIIDYYETFSSETKEKLKQNINIYDLNIFSKKYKIDDNYGFSKAWINKNKRIARLLTMQFFRNKINSSSKDLYWTTFLSSQKYVEGGGIMKGFSQLNQIPTEKRNNLGFIANLYINSFVKNNSLEKLDDNKYALSLLLKWIINVSNIEKPIHLFLPSIRMKTLLIEWLNEK